jgi:hypothetical protein
VAVSNALEVKQKEEAAAVSQAPSGADSGDKALPANQANSTEAPHNAQQESAAQPKPQSDAPGSSKGAQQARPAQSGRMAARLVNGKWVFEPAANAKASADAAQ